MRPAYTVVGVTLSAITQRQGSTIATNLQVFNRATRLYNFGLTAPIAMATGTCCSRRV